MGNFTLDGSNSFDGFNTYSYCSNNPINKKRYTSSLGIELITFATNAVYTVFLSSPLYDYIHNESINHNCYSYAFRLPNGRNPGEFSIYDDIYKSKKEYTVEEFCALVMRDMLALGKDVVIVNSPSEKSYDQYIVALKSSTKLNPYNYVTDYHFAVQLSDGTWADKPGKYPSRIGALDGEARYWDAPNQKGYYDTNTIFFAVRK